MTVSQTTAPDPDDDAILAFIEESVRALQADGHEPRSIVVGPRAYDALRHAMARRYGRSPGAFEQFQWLTIVVDPFRDAEVCVLPPPAAVAAGVRTVEV